MYNIYIHLEVGLHGEAQHGQLFVGEPRGLRAFTKEFLSRISKAVS